jgi:aminoglycoside phosphotransferase (APT) family kinase protein
MTSDADALAVAAIVTGRAATTAVRQTFGHGSAVYRVDTGAGDVIVRMHTDPRVYAGTVANLDRLRALGLPVPTVLGTDTTRSRFPYAYVVTDTFPGRDLRFEVASMTDAQATRLAERIVSYERLVTTALPAGDGFGFAPIGVRPPHRTWPDAIRADRDGVPDAVVSAALDRADARLRARSPTCFLDDLTIKNVIVSGGELRGVVDFDVVCYGDPMYWLALTQVAMLSDVGAPGRFYVDELVRLWAPTDAERADLALYSAVHAAAFLGWDTDDAERGERLRSAITAWCREAA